MIPLFIMIKFPQNVSKLFRPGPPLQYKKPVDYPVEERKTANKIQGLSGYLGALDTYRSEHPEGSENGHLDAYNAAENARQVEAKALNAKLAIWNPDEDPNIADSDPYRTIFVGRLPFAVTEVELQKEFVRFGEIEKVRVVRDKTSNKSRGYGFIMFKDEISARSACREIGVHRGVQIGGRPVIVDIERGRTVKYFTPRRLGGGLGGRGYMKRDKLAKLASAVAKDEPKTTPRGPPPSSFPSGPRSRFNAYSGAPARAAPPPERAPAYRSRQNRTSRFQGFRPDY